MSFVSDAAGILRVSAWTEETWLIHGFTTPSAGDFTRGRIDHRQIAEAIHAQDMRIHTVRQIHSSRLVAVQLHHNASFPPAEEEADGLITSLAGDAVAVRTADCVPILLIDRRNRSVAAVHAGWRGTAARIVGNAVDAVRREFGSRPDELEAALGPAIGPCCFEVGEEVAAQFAPPLIRRNTKPHIDLIEANRGQLLGAGLRRERIWSADTCTFCAPQRLYSYRRQGVESGRMLAFAGIRANSEPPA